LISINGSIWQQSPDLLYVLIVYSDATVGPVFHAMQFADPTKAVRQTVNEDISSGRNSLSAA
jgi:hypothetical protein